MTTFLNSRFSVWNSIMTRHADRFVRMVRYRSVRLTHVCMLPHAAPLSTHACFQHGVCIKFHRSEKRGAMLPGEKF